MPKLLSKAVEWLGGHELGLLVGLLVVSAGCWGFIELADEVLEGDTQAFDEYVLKSLRTGDDLAAPIGPGWLPEAARDITSLGGEVVLALMIAAVVGFLCLDRRYGAMWFVILASSTGMLMGFFLKSVFSRPRPIVVPHLHEVHSLSFPSGHSLMSALVYLTLGSLLARLATTRRLKFYCLATALILTGLIGASRIYLGVHYPTDVLAGWTAGLVWATVCWIVARILQRRGTIEKEL